MAWSADLRDRLRSGRVHLGLILEVVRPLNGEGVGIDGWFAASDPSMGASAEILLGRTRLGSSGVSPQTWAYQEGAWSVTLKVSDGTVLGSSRTQMQYASRALKRGALVRLYIGESGTPRSSYAPLKMGRINRITSRAPGTLEVEAWDIMTALRTRLAAGGASADEQAQLFYGTVGQGETIVTSNYSTGDASILTSGSPVDRFVTETGGDGAIKVVGNTSTFYLSFTGSSTGPNQITGLSSTGQYGTTASNAAIGNVITSTALLEGHPLVILRRLLTSTGAGTNGVRDDYPRPWGLGLPADLLGDSDWNQLRLLISLSSGVYAWRLLVEEEIEDPAAWIAAVWNPAGIWLTVKEGLIVPRCGRDPNTQYLLVEEEITAADLVGNDAPFVEWFPQEVPVVYHRSSVTGNGSTTSSTSNVNALPAYEQTTHDLTAVMISVANAGMIRSEVVDRLSPWDHFVPEYATMRLRGVRSYAPGDVVPVTLPELVGRLDGTVSGYRQRLCMVVRESIDLSTNATVITVAALPTDYQEDSP